MEPASDDVLLTAYIDGELLPKDRQRVERRLTEESALRQRLAELEETWHYLDLLEREDADAEKIETTMKVTAISLSTAPFLPPKVSRLSKILGSLIVSTALFVTSFYIGWQGWVLLFPRTTVLQNTSAQMDEENKRIAETLAALPFSEKDYLLNEEPATIISELRSL